MLKNSIPPDRFLISTAPERLDLEFLFRYLSQSYWANDLTPERLQTSIDNSLCFGVYEHHQQIGFARVITDRATFGYLADVFIDEAYKGLGLGSWLVKCVQQHPDLTGLRKLLLQTEDAHTFYKPLGFTPLVTPSIFMQWVSRGEQDQNL